MTEVTIQTLREHLGTLNTGYINFEHKTLINSDGSRLRARKNGMLKLWKTRPDDFKLPCKHGFKTCFYITQDNAHEWEIV